jgi:hypothetical protein
MKRSLFLRLLFFVPGIAFGFPSVSAPVLPVVSCPAKVLQFLFPIEPELGSAIAIQKVAKFLPPDLVYEARELGQGASGTVYRVFPKKYPNKSLVLKVMAGQSAYHDTVSFGLVEEAAFRSPDVTVVSHQVLKATGDFVQDEMAMQVQDIKGRTLFSVLADPQIPETIKVSLRERDTNFGKKLEENFLKSHGVSIQKIKAHKYYFRSEGNWYDLPDEKIIQQPEIMKWTFAPRKILGEVGKETNYFNKLQKVFGSHLKDWVDAPLNNGISVILKSDNIIVTPDYHLYLIDPA